ncbi:unnamed protein product [Microthlaspi erraticum]|uniref:HTH La-type RNA-binding domain-containing protein n=1 Tax=Microthlaspi erraticum TaxID=1685480 RepID=A0A6D2KWY9_9BRAS|nr:unnamed protein product [Microthlaspi erraticum]
MAPTKESSAAANSASGCSTDPRSRPDSSPWTAAASEAIHDHRAPCDYDNADKKPAWNKPSTSSAHVGPVMGAESWPALSLSASSKSLSSDGSSSSPMPPPQAAGTCLISTSKSHTNANANANNANANANAGSSAAAAAVAVAASSENHHVNGQRKPVRRNNSTSSSTSNPAPLNTRDQNHSLRGGSYASGTSPHFRNSNRNRNGSSSYPRGDNRRNFEHGNQTGFAHRNYNGRDMPSQPPPPPQRGFGMMRPQMMMGPPSFPASSAQYLAAPQLGSYGGPMLYPDIPPHVVMPPPESMALVGHFSPLQMYFTGPDPMLYHKILTQVEYYFSADNLSKDGYLRRQMNDQGWVSVTVIAGFRKLTEMTNNIQTILEALRSSEVVEIKGEALRRRGDWDKYLLPNEPSRSGPVATAAANNKNVSLESHVESMTLSERTR